MKKEYVEKKIHIGLQYAKEPVCVQNINIKRGFLFF